MRTITTDYRDAQILDLGSGYEKGPFLVTQMGVAPNDPVPKTKMFVLRHRVVRRSEEHTSELQSHSDLVCRLLLEKKKNMIEMILLTCSTSVNIYLNRA